MENLYSTQDAADFLKVPTRTIENWKRLGKIFPRRTELGKDFYAEEDLRKFPIGKIETDDKKNSADLATSGEKNIISNDNRTDYIKAVSFSQHLENLPEELFSSKRFFPVGADKIPHLKDWSNPDNQSLCTDIQGVAGFDTCGHGVGDDYLFLDFDHVLDDAGAFINPLAEKWYNMIHASQGLLTGCYCECSISGHGLHIFAKPTRDKFPAINGGDKGSIYFTSDKKNGAKIEIFYKSSGRYCLVTGNIFNCESRATIPMGMRLTTFSKVLLMLYRYLNLRGQIMNPQSESPISLKLKKFLTLCQQKNSFVTIGRQLA